MFLEWLAPVTGLLPEETCSPRVCRGTNCSLADACRNAKCSDSLHQGLALKSVRRFRPLRKQTLSSLFPFWVSWRLVRVPFQSSQKPGSALDPASLGDTHQLLISLSEISTRNVCLALLSIASHSIPGLLHYQKGEPGNSRGDAEWQWGTLPDDLPFCCTALTLRILCFCDHWHPGWYFKSIWGLLGTEVNWKTRIISHLC